MSLLRTFALACCGVFVACLITACGGGGGGGGPPPPPQFVVSPTNLSFSAASPSAATPPTQTVMATIDGVSAQTLFIRIVVTGPAVANVTNPIITGPTTGQATVIPQSPAVLGPGTHSSVITVSACTTDINCSGPQLTGSPATINVTYQVAVPPPPDAVAPSVGTAGVSGEVILRGSGFTPVNSVSFGGLPAVSFTVLSSTEIRATYPALAAGPQPVFLNNGAIPFTASLQIVGAAAFTSTTLQYPQTVQSLRGLAYDARRFALIVGAGFSTSFNNQVWRYAFDGANWQATPLMAFGSDLRDLTLSRDGERLLTINNVALVERDPITLIERAQRVPLPPNGVPIVGSFLKAIVAANDGQAVVVSGGPNLGPRWLYAIAPRTFTGPGADDFSQPVAGGPDDGSRVVLIQGGSSPDRPIRQYSASSGVMSAAPVTLAHSPGVAIGGESINPPVFDRSGSRMIVAFDGGAIGVFDANFGELGRLPAAANSTIAAYALSPDGKRAYVLDVGTSVCQVRAFNLDVAAPGGGQPFDGTGVGAPVDLSANCPTSNLESPVRMLLDPPGSTLFIAGNLRIRVVTPLP